MEKRKNKINYVFIKVHRVSIRNKNSNKPCVESTVSSPIAGEEKRSTHSERFNSRISPEYRKMPSPSLDTINTAGRLSVDNFRLATTSVDVTT